MNKRIRKERITLTLVILILIFTALVSTRIYHRFDVTDTKAYTLSNISKDTFLQLESNIEITYYISQQLLNYSPKAQQIIDFLNEYSAGSKGKIKLRIQDPVQSREVGLAEDLGILPRELDINANSESRTITIYTGIVIRYLDNYKSIPMVLDTTELEYNLTMRIKALALGQSLKAGIIIGDDSRRLSEDYAMLLKTLENTFSIREIRRGETIQPYLDAVVVLGGKDMDSGTVTNIKEYIDNGGNILLSYKPVYIDLNNDYKASIPGNNLLGDLLADYGIIIPEELVLDENCREMAVPGRWPIDYYHWVSVNKSYTDSLHPVTSGMAGLDLLWPGRLIIKETAGVSINPIASSTNSSWLMKEKFFTNPYKQNLFTASDADKKESYTLAAAGTVNGGKSKMLIISDYDFVTNMLRFSQSDYNLIFFENALQWTADSEDMLSLKNRTLRDTRLNSITDKNKEQRLFLTAAVINIVFIPITVILVGVIYLSRRRNTGREEPNEK